MSRMVLFVQVINWESDAVFLLITLPNYSKHFVPLLKVSAKMRVLTWGRELVCRFFCFFFLRKEIINYCATKSCNLLFQPPLGIVCKLLAHHTDLLHQYRKSTAFLKSQNQNYESLENVLWILHTVLAWFALCWRTCILGEHWILCLL